METLIKKVLTLDDVRQLSPGESVLFIRRVEPCYAVQGTFQKTEYVKYVATEGLWLRECRIQNSIIQPGVSESTIEEFLMKFEGQKRREEGGFFFQPFREPEFTLYTLGN